MKLLKFHASWCAPCKRVTATLEERHIEVESHDVEEESQLAYKYGVMSVPVLVVLDSDGNEVARHNNSEKSGVIEFLSEHGFTS